MLEPVESLSQWEVLSVTESLFYFYSSVGLKFFLTLDSLKSENAHVSTALFGRLFS